MIFRRLFAAFLFIAALSSQAAASQGSGCMPTTGTVSGLTLVQDINNGIAALISSNSGATAPATDCTAVAVLGQLWVDTSGSPKLLKVYDGANWLTIGAIDASGHLWKPPVGGGTETLASATTTDLCSVAGSYVSISGTTTITGFSNTCAAGAMKFLSFVSTPQVTYNATSMILPGAASITAQAGDSALAVYLGSGNWKVVAWTRADGTSISGSSVFTGAVYFNAVISPSALGSNTNDWSPTGLATANTIRFSCSAAYNITGISASATDGKIIVLDNIGATNTCTLTSQDASSTAANRLALPFAVQVRPLSQVAIRYDLTTARWKLWQEIPSQSIAGGFKNLRVFNVATVFGDSAPGTPNSQMKIAADQLTVEDANGTAKRLTSVACTIVASANSFSSGSGGLDTGSLAAGNWYSEWVIYAPATNTTSCLASLAQTIGTITLPSGYTFGARVGWNYYLTANAVTGFQRVIQYGNTAHYVVTASTPTNIPPNAVNGASGTFSTTSPTLTSVSLTALVPPTAAAVQLNATTIYNGLGPNGLLVAPSTAWGGTNNGPSGSNLMVWPIYINAPQVSSQVWFDLDAASFGYAGNNGGAVSVTAWRDNL